MTVPNISHDTPTQAVAIAGMMLGALFALIGLISHFDALRSGLASQSGAGLFMGLNVGFACTSKPKGTVSNQGVLKGMHRWSQSLVLALLPILYDT